MHLTWTQLALLLLTVFAANSVLGGDADPEEHKGDIESPGISMRLFPEKFELQPTPVCAKRCFSNPVKGRDTAYFCAEACFICTAVVHHMFALKETRQLELSAMMDFCSRLYPDRNSEERLACKDLAFDAFDTPLSSPPTLKPQWDFHLDTQSQGEDRYQQIAYMCQATTCCSPLDIVGSAKGIGTHHEYLAYDGSDVPDRPEIVMAPNDSSRNAVEDGVDDPLDGAGQLLSTIYDDGERSDSEKLVAADNSGNGGHEGDEEHKGAEKTSRELRHEKLKQERQRFSSVVTEITASRSRTVDRYSYEGKVDESQMCKICTDMVAWAVISENRIRGSLEYSPVKEFCDSHPEFSSQLCYDIGRRLLVTVWSRTWLQQHFGGFSKEYTSFRNLIGSAEYEKLTGLSLCTFSGHCSTQFRAYGVEYYRSSAEVFAADKDIFQLYIEERSADIHGLSSLKSEVEKLIEKWSIFLASTSMAHVIFVYKATKEEDPALKRLILSSMEDIATQLQYDQEEVMMRFSDLAAQSVTLSGRMTAFAKGLVLGSVQREDHLLRMEAGVAAIPSWLTFTPMSLSRATSVDQSTPEDTEALDWYQKAQKFAGSDSDLAKKIQAASSKEVLIGRGGGGFVYSTEIDSGTVVLKRLTVDFNIQFERNVQEIRANLAIKHKIQKDFPDAPFVVFHGFFPEYNEQARSYFTMVYEYVPYSLERLLEERGDDISGNPEVIQEIATQLMKAVYLMASKADLIHRDLKLENVLMKPIPKDQPLTRANIKLKVADYDRSLFLGEEKDKPYPNRFDDSVTTPDIMPPEALATSMTPNDIRVITCGKGKGVECLDTETDSCPFPIGTMQLLEPFVKKRTSIMNIFEKDKSIVDDLYEMAPGSMLEAFDIWSVGVMLAQIGSGDRFFMEKVAAVLSRRSIKAREEIREDAEEASRSRRKSKNRVNEYGANLGVRPSKVLPVETSSDVDDSDDDTPILECGKPDICVGDALWENRCRLQVIFLASHVLKEGSYSLGMPNSIFFMRDLPGYEDMLSHMLVYEPSKRSLPLGHDFLTRDVSHYTGYRSVRTRSLLRVVSSQLYDFQTIPRLDVCSMHLDKEDNRFHWRATTCLVCHVIVDVLAQLKLEDLVGPSSFYYRCAHRVVHERSLRTNFCKAMTDDLFRPRKGGPKIQAYLRAIDVYEYYKGDSSKATEICQMADCCRPVQTFGARENSNDMCNWCRSAAALWTEELILNPKSSLQAVQSSLQESADSVCPSNNKKKAHEICTRMTRRSLSSLIDFAKLSRSWWMVLKGRTSLETLVHKFASAECDMQYPCFAQTLKNRKERTELESARNTPMGLAQAGGAIMEILHGVIKLIEQHTSLSRQRLGSVQSTMELINDSDDWSEQSLTAMKSYKVACVKHAESVVKFSHAVAVFALTLRDVDFNSSGSLRSLQASLASVWRQQRETSTADEQKG